MDAAEKRGVSTNPGPDRRRAIEGMSPRWTDRIAHRLRALAAWARGENATALIDGTTVDASSLGAMAEEQDQAEREMLTLWNAIAEAYPDYLRITREREELMRVAIEAFEQNHRDKASCRALRLCKLRRPSVAKVAALCANAK